MKRRNLKGNSDLLRMWKSAKEHMENLVIEQPYDDLRRLKLARINDEIQTISDSKTIMKNTLEIKEKTIYRAITSINGLSEDFVSRYGAMTEKELTNAIGRTVNAIK